MSPAIIFDSHLVLGYAAWLLCTRVWVWPRLKAMATDDAQRAIAMLHSFRFFGLVFILPGVVGPALPEDFATFAAWGDLVTGVLAMAALSVPPRPALFRPLVVAFNVAGMVDLVVDYYHGTTLDLAGLSGQLGAAYVIPIVYVPILMITHVIAFRLLLRPIKSANTSIPAAA